jgi:hypothetical protein
MIRIQQKQQLDSYRPAYGPGEWYAGIVCHTLNQRPYLNHSLQEQSINLDKKDSVPFS